MRHVLEQTLLLEAHEVVVNENQHRASGRHRWIHGGRFEAWNDADQVGEQDEYKKSSEKGQKTGAIMADAVLGLAVKKRVDHFEDVLRFAGPVHRQARPQVREYDDDDR